VSTSFILTGGADGVVTVSNVPEINLGERKKMLLGRGRARAVLPRGPGPSNRCTLRALFV